MNSKISSELENIFRVMLKNRRWMQEMPNLKDAMSMWDRNTENISNKAGVKYDHWGTSLYGGGGVTYEKYAQEMKSLANKVGLWKSITDFVPEEREQQIRQFGDLKRANTPNYKEWLQLQEMNGSKRYL